METTFIYALNDPETGECRYVGKANDPHDRLFGPSGHLYDARNAKNTYHCATWLRSLIARGLVPYLEILQEVLDSEWETWERAWIKASREIGMDLTNGTDGGDSPPSHRGKKKSLLWLSKIKGRKSPMRNKKHTLAATYKMSIAQRGKQKPNNTSGYVGVRWDAERKKWKAQITTNCKNKLLGRFSKIEDAIFVYNLSLENYKSERYLKCQKQ